MPPLQQTLDAGVLTLTLDRPEQRNTLDAALIEALHAALDRADLDAAVRVVAIRGAGSDFCAGAELESADARGGTLGDDERDARRLGALFQRYHTIPKPVIAVVHGMARASGIALASACDIVIAGDSARFSIADPRGGVMPTVGMAALPGAGRSKTILELALTGRTLSAAEAAAAGLISRVISDAALDAEAERLGRELAGLDPSMLALTKQLFYRLDGLTLTDGIDIGARVSALVRQRASTPPVSERISRR